MVTEVTKGIRVSVETEYQSKYSSPRQFHYVFTYKVTIENESDSTVQLKSRRWHIKDATYNDREIEGEGVVGQQPIIEPGQEHVYVSGCNLKSGIGKMIGIYVVERIIDGKELEVKIPEFVMMVPDRSN
jgi:ApaG protein